MQRKNIIHLLVICKFYNYTLNIINLVYDNNIVYIVMWLLRCLNIQHQHIIASVECPIYIVFIGTSLYSNFDLSLHIIVFKNKKSIVLSLT